MKNTILFLYLFQMITLTSCDSVDNNNSQNPINQLPPVTQTGANTLGALLDGEPFIPSGGNNPLDSQYQLINGERYFQLQGNKRDENFNVIAISLSTIAKDIAQGETYNLVEEATGNVSGAYSFNGDLFFTSEQNSGQLIITHLDINEQIVSGTFWFDVIHPFTGEIAEIREGRFDMQYTQ